MSEAELLAAANAARANSYAPYSGFSVGAALLCEDGTVITGVNCENASYPAGFCAERAAIGAAVTSGRRNFRAIAVAGNTPLCFPCGICRQVLAEFCDETFPVILADPDGSPHVFALSDLLPYSFTAKSMEPISEV